MGADLYIWALYERPRQKWAARFEEAVKARDALDNASPEYPRAQRRVERCFAKMNSCGHFRDSYNATNLLWQFELSWWNDVAALLDDEGQHVLTPEAAITFLRMLEDREPVFEANVATLAAAEERYFRKEYRALRHFLNEAIDAKEPIACSL